MATPEQLRELALNIAAQAVALAAGNHCAGSNYEQARRIHENAEILLTLTPDDGPHRGPSVVSNFSDLSPCMRAALPHRPDRAFMIENRTTAAALQRRGLVTSIDNQWYRLTDAGARAHAAFEKAET